MFSLFTGLLFASVLRQRNAFLQCRRNVPRGANSSEYSVASDLITQENREQRFLNFYVNPEISRKVLAQSEMLVLKDRELKETRNLYSAVKDMLALQPSPEIQQTLNRTQRALAQRTTKMKCLIAELSMREKQVADLRLELERVNNDLGSFKQRYYEMKRALDADEARRLRVPSPGSKHSLE